MTCADYQRTINRFIDHEVKATECAELFEHLGKCAEFCGTAQANMRLQVVVEPADAFSAWVAQQKQPAPAPTTARAQKGLLFITTFGCQACHAIRGTSAQGKAGPDLTHVAGCKTIAAGLLTFNAENLRAWIGNPPAMKPSTTMPKMPMPDDEIDAAATYLATLK